MDHTTVMNHAVHAFFTKARSVKQVGASLAIVSVAFSITIGCNRYRDDLDYSFAVEQEWDQEHLASGQLMQFEGVRHSPDQGGPLSRAIIVDSIAQSRRVLDLDCQTGWLSLLSSQNGGKHVVAVADSPAAKACSQYNAALQEAALANAGCPVEVRVGELTDVVAASGPFDLIFVLLDPANVERLPDFLDAIKQGLDVGGRGWIGGVETAGDQDWDLILAEHGLCIHTVAPEKSASTKNTAVDEPPADDEMEFEGEVLQVKLHRGADVKQEKAPKGGREDK